ncbi:MAG: hypothetical protein HGB17_15910, partial [Syntrophobacteraceae bacterium]|nr:hypothetical protein [Syntrophobacteraceae bacterium]
MRDAYIGGGVSIAIVDTGIDYTHSRLGGAGFPNDKAIGGYDYGGSANNPNSEDNDLAVIDLSDPGAPILVEKISLDAYGAGLNSVDAHDGLVAVAVEASPKTNPGRVV